jgi:putative flippase GtrA
MGGSLAQVGKFGLVGVLNTLIDFGIFNALTSGGRVSKVKANLCSTSVAMIFSFTANRQEVFAGQRGNPWEQAALFFVVTGIGVYGLQTGVLYLLVNRWQWPAQMVRRGLKLGGMQRHRLDDVLLRNGGKACGTVVSLTWNFVLYKYVVFR